MNQMDWVRRENVWASRKYIMRRFFDTRHSGCQSIGGQSAGRHVRTDRGLVAPVLRTCHVWSFRQRSTVVNVCPNVVSTMAVHCLSVCLSVSLSRARARVKIMTFRIMKEFINKRFLPTSICNSGWRTKIR